jgi:hypothetical protein
MGFADDLCSDRDAATLYAMIEIRTDSEGRIHGRISGSTEELEKELSALLRFLHRDMWPLYQIVPYTLDTIRREEGHA